MGKTMILAGFLTVCTYLDVRYRKIPFWFLLAGMFAGILSVCFTNGICWETIQILFCGLLPGIGICLAACFLPGKVGMADGWMIMAAGEIGGWKTGIFLLEWGLIFMFPIAFFWGVIKKKRNMELPFAPFLMGGFLWQILCTVVW